MNVIVYKKGYAYTLPMSSLLSITKCPQLKSILTISDTLLMPVVTPVVGKSGAPGTLLSFVNMSKQ